MEIIGDVYMVVLGLLIRNGYNYVVEIVGMVFYLIEGVKWDFKVLYRFDYKIELCVGIYSGKFM